MSLALQHMPSRVLLKHLVDAGQAGDVAVSPLPAWPGYVEAEPAVPDNVITIYDTTAIDVGNDFLDRTFYPGVTIRVRAQTPDVCMIKASNLAHYIDEVLNQAVIVLGPNTYLIETGSVPGGPVRVGKESPGSQRSIYNVNATLTMKRVT